MNTHTPIISCIVRHHAPGRMLELQRCLFSLAGQTCSDIEVILMLQRFSGNEVHLIAEKIEPLLRLRDDFSVHIIDFHDESQGDARTSLLNTGIRYATGKYVAFLDYDDVVYPEAYDLLVNEIKNSNCGIAFASVRVVKANLHSDYVYATSAQENVFQGKTLKHLFTGNFCPLHSYLIDNNVIRQHNISFNPELQWEEDYDFLLQITSKAAASFSLIGTCIGDYYIKNDASNTIGTEGVEGKLSAEKQLAYESVCAQIENRRLRTRISEQVQYSIGVEHVNPNLTIRSYIDQP